MLSKCRSFQDNFGAKISNQFGQILTKLGVKGLMFVGLWERVIPPRCIKRRDGLASYPRLGE